MTRVILSSSSVSLSASTVHSIVCDVDSLVYIDVISYVNSVYVLGVYVI